MLCPFRLFFVRLQLSLWFDDVSVYSDTLGGSLLLCSIFWLFPFECLIYFPFYHQFAWSLFRGQHAGITFKKTNHKCIFTTSQFGFHLNVDVGLLFYIALNIYPGVYWLGVGQILETVSITGKKQHKTHTKNKQ